MARRAVSLDWEVGEIGAVVDGACILLDLLADQQWPPEHGDHPEGLRPHLGALLQRGDGEGGRLLDEEAGGAGGEAAVDAVGAPGIEGAAAGCNQRCNQRWFRCNQGPSGELGEPVLEKEKASCGFAGRLWWS
jgi:hypothetical protein